ncbi:MAG: GTP 3',8-cyclase MoaA [Anaerovoracaceae bacterium]
MKDRLGREIDYMRISITDRCNLRCGYCMPECGVPSVPHDMILRFDEIVRLVKIFCSLGIKNVKITGGEPLVRKGTVGLIKDIKVIEDIEKVSMTTNGILLSENLKALSEAGIDSINISLDTLDRQKYQKITGFDGLDTVLKAIDECGAFPEIKVKINTVTLADYNRNEICALADFAAEAGATLRFIEMMPLGLGTGFGGYNQDEIMTVLEEAYGLAKTINEEVGSGPAKYYSFEGLEGRIGFISPMSHKFCGSCNRIRLTSEGLLRPCLGSDKGVDLRKPMREGASDEELASLICEEITDKPAGHRFETTDSLMSKIGG